eukprot:6033548-Heterocapsa_arctica.AAC.1
MHAYGTAQQYWHLHQGIHGFIRPTSYGGYRFYTPRELLVAQGFPRHTVLPEEQTEAWELIGNAIPPPLAAIGLAPFAFLAAWHYVDPGTVSPDWLKQWLTTIVQNI